METFLPLVRVSAPATTMKTTQITSKTKKTEKYNTQTAQLDGKTLKKERITRLSTVKK
jgi:hypothetical protein